MARPKHPRKDVNPSPRDRLHQEDVDDFLSSEPVTEAEIRQTQLGNASQFYAQRRAR